VIGQPSFPGRDEVSQRPARLAAFFIRLLTEKVKSIEHLFAFVVRIQFDIVAHGAGGKQSIYAARRDQFLLDDGIQESVAFGKELARLRTLSLVLKNAGINALQPPGVERTGSSQ
jgi:hypothetical protein